MPKFTGQVFKVYPKQFPGKPMTYSVKLEDQPLFHRMGTERYAGIVEPGKVIEFEATPNSDGKSAQVQGTIREVVQAPAAAPGSPALPNNTGRDNSIQYQSARKDAIEFVDLLVRNEALKLGKDAAKKEGILFAALDRYTAFFFKDIATLGAVVREAESEGESPEAEAAADDGE